MKRSEINGLLDWTKDFLERNNIKLPDLAYCSPDELKRQAARLDVVKKLELGWDITDFGSGDFARIGAVLYTVRNGLLNEPSVGVPYCEKYIVMQDGQHLPKHYHVFKSEDIINRAGGDFFVQLWNADKTSGKTLDTDVHVRIDGIEHVVKPGEEVIIRKGQSISLTPYIAHVFGPKPGAGDCIIGEVSKVNDDHTDNYFLDQISRFADIEEDELPLHLLCNEYGKFGI